MEYAHLAKHIAQPPEDKQHRTGDDTVDARHPLYVRHTDAKLPLKRRQRDVDDGAVENLHERHGEYHNKRSALVMLF